MADGPWRIIVIGGPWPERIGCQGVTVPDGPDRYPWHKLPKGEQVILLDDDPLSGGQDSEPRWTCVMPIKHLHAVEDIVRDLRQRWWSWWRALTHSGGDT